jgi:hypothetical protein
MAGPIAYRRPMIWRSAANPTWTIWVTDGIG